MSSAGCCAHGAGEDWLAAIKASATLCLASHDVIDTGTGSAHHEHQVVRPGVAEQLRETTATRRVYGTPVGRPTSAADARDARRKLPEKW